MSIFHSFQRPRPAPTDPLNLRLALRDALTAAGQPLRPEALAARFADTSPSQLTEHLHLLRQLGALVERDGAWAPR